MATKQRWSCSLKDCKSGEIDLNDGRIEIRATISKQNNKKLETFKVRWQNNGDAILHYSCWELILKAYRARTKKGALVYMSAAEKSLIREAIQTAEFHDPNETLVEEAKRISEMIKKAKYCVVFSGAGISTSAGIGDYRGRSGKWTEEDRIADEKHEAQEVLDVEPQRKIKKSSDEEESDDEETLEEGVPYEELRPTYTHEGLYKLFQMGLIKHVISQNGDGLHGLSGFPSENLSELHGNVFLEKCELCGLVYERPYYVLDDNASSYFEDLNENDETDIKKPKNALQCATCGLTHRTGRKCSKKGCKGFLMDTIINFGDDLEEKIFERATANASLSDLMLCMGTTMTVTPANELVEVGNKPLRLVICNRQKTSLDKVCLTMDSKDKPLGSRVFGDCDMLMKKIMSFLLLPLDLQEWENGREKRMEEYSLRRTNK